MTATIRDSALLRTVPPLDVVAYLRAQHWRQAEKLDGGAVWVKAHEGESLDLLLPLDSSLRDFPLRMAEVLATLERAEKRSQLEILEDLVTASADIVRPRLPGANHIGEISLEQGRTLYDQARNLMLAAACAAWDKRSLYSRRKPEAAMRFLEHARFGMPRRGSYIMTIVSPVSPKLLTGEAGQDFAEEPFERRTTRTLAEAIQALAVAAPEVAATGALTPMKEAVALGVSANLCEAILGLHEGSGEKGVDFAFTWAPSRGAPPNALHHASFTPDTIAIIRETARIFRETETLAGIEIVGVVKRLDSQGDQAGRATLLASVEGAARTIAVELSGAEHSLAVRSYEERLPISCVGELVREGRTWMLQNPREIHLLLESI